MAKPEHTFKLDVSYIVVTVTYSKDSMESVMDISVAGKTDYHTESTWRGKAEFATNRV